MSNYRAPDPLGFEAAQPTRVYADSRSALRKGQIGSFLLLLPGSGEPAMILMRADLKGRSVAIQKARLHLYVEERTGMPTPRLAAKAREVAQLLGIDPLDANVTDIMDMVMRQAPDLLAMARRQ